MPLSRVVQELRNELAKSQRTASQQKNSLNETNTSLRADLRTQKTNLGAFVDTMARTSLTGFLLSTSIERKKIEQLHDQLAALQGASNQEKNNLNETIDSLRNELRVEHQNSGTSIVNLTHASLTSTSVSQKNRTSRTNQPGTPRESR